MEKEKYKTAEQIKTKFYNLVDQARDDRGNPDVKQYLLDNPPSDDINYNGVIMTIAILIDEGVLYYDQESQKLYKLNKRPH